MENIKIQNSSNYKNNVVTPKEIHLKNEINSNTHHFNTDDFRESRFKKHRSSKRIIKNKSKRSSIDEGSNSLMPKANQK
jgi:hypothetical protein